MAAEEVGAFVASWITPIFLFLFLNLIVASIAIISTFGSPPSDHQQHQKPPPLSRASSLLSRITSFNLSHFHHHDGSDHHVPEPSPAERPYPPLQRAPSLLSRFASFNLSFNRYGQSDAVNVSQAVETAQLVSAGVREAESTTGERRGGGGGVESREHHVARTLSEPSKIACDEEDEKVFKITKSASEKWESEADEEEEVDAKADDFINRFKQQLKLQRLESLLRNRSASSAGPAVI